MRRTEDVAYLRDLPPDQQPWYGRGRGMAVWGWSVSCWVWGHPVVSLLAYLGLGAAVGAMAASRLIGPESEAAWKVVVGGGAFSMFVGVAALNWFSSWFACRNALVARDRPPAPGTAPSWGNGPALPPPPPPGGAA